MRVLFWGTPLFSVPSLEHLSDAPEHQLIAVVTQPDKPRGRGKKTSYSEVKARALEMSLPVLQPVSTKDEDFIARVQALGTDISVIAAYGKILHRRILDLPRYGSICLHPSLLPRYRGAAPIQRAIMDGISETGVTLFQMDEGMDTGPIILQKPVPVTDCDTLDSLTEKLAQESADILLDGLSLIASGALNLLPQEGEPSVAPKVSKEEALIDWSKDACKIERQVRAFNSRPGAYTFIDGQKLKIYRVSPVPEEYEAEPGRVVGVSSDSIIVSAGSGWLAIRELQLEGRRRMDTASYLRGRKIDAGTKLG